MPIKKHITRIVVLFIIVGLSLMVLGQSLHIQELSKVEECPDVDDLPSKIEVPSLVNFTVIYLSCDHVWPFINPDKFTYVHFHAVMNDSWIKDSRVHINATYSSNIFNYTLKLQLPQVFHDSMLISDMTVYFFWDSSQSLQVFWNGSIIYPSV